MQQKTYTIQFTEAGFNYVRQVLGQRPLDEAGPLVANMEIQRAQQDRPEPPVEAPPRVPQAVVVPLGSVNGSGEGSGAHLAQ